jgi:hypothetical protein
MDDMTDRRDRGGAMGRRYWWVSALLIAILVLTVFNIVSTIGRMQSRTDLFAPFLECVERNGGTYAQPDQWIKAGGRPLVIASEPISEADAEIHSVCWQQVTYVGP